MRGIDARDLDLACGEFQKLFEVAIAEGRFYADATRSIEYAAMAGFFVPNSELAADLAEYFASFQQIISYLYDPSGFFEANLRRAGAKQIIRAFAPIDDSEHATRQLARPLQSLALYLEDSAPVLHPTEEDREFARNFLGGTRRPLVAEALTVGVVAEIERKLARRRCRQEADDVPDLRTSTVCGPGCSVSSSVRPTTSIRFGSRSFRPCELTVRQKSTGSPPAPTSSSSTFGIALA